MGYAADFCPLCRNIQTFSVCRATDAESLALSPTRRAVDGPAFYQVCQSCQARVPSDPSLFAMLRARPDEALNLMDSTNPAIGDTYAQRFDLEERLSHSPRGIPREQRMALLFEPFATLSWEVDELFTPPPPWSLRRLALAAPLGILPVVTLYYIIGSLFSVLLWFSVALCCWYGYRTGQLYRRPRVLRTRIIPLLARTLAPLHPSRRELDDVLKLMSELDREIGTRIQASDLLVAMPQYSRRRRQQRDAGPSMGT